jgi:trehalose-6-phosphate synthase
VREARPDVVTSHFVHIPWPEADYWHALPAELRIAVHEGLLANDVVGFHAERWRRAFLLSAERLLGARMDGERGTVEHRGHETKVLARPSWSGVRRSSSSAWTGPTRRRTSCAAFTPSRCFSSVTPSCTGRWG